MGMSKSGVLGVVVTIAKVSTTTAGKPYAAAAPQHGGHFCIFPIKGDENAAKLVERLEAGVTYTFLNVGFADGSVYVYGDSKVSKA